jgi:hypothetical protein
MKRFQLCRTYLKDSTVGIISLSLVHKITSLELPWLDNQVGRSCIPEGVYLVKRDTTGKHKWFKIIDVENRTFIEIHESYKVSHLQGCIGLDIVSLQDLIIVTEGKDFELEITS